MKNIQALNAEVGDLKKRIERIEKRVDKYEHVLAIWMEMIDKKLGETNALLFNLDMHNKGNPPDAHPTPRI